MARYRDKDETDMAWNRMRRRITRELDTQIQDWREIALNTLLASAWDKYVASLNSGEVLELEPAYESWVSQALADSIAQPVIEEDAAA